jgi:hypothetical protein
MLMYCCPINGTKSPTESESVVGSVPLLITEILADMTKEETKAQGFTILSEFRKEWSKITKHLIDLEETVTAYGFRNTEKQQEQSTKP